MVLYALGLGGLRLPGVSRAEVVTGESWVSVSTVARKVTEVWGVLLSLGGALFGILGYLLPWVYVQAGISGPLLDIIVGLIPQVREIGQVSGSWSGAAIALQGLILGITLIARGSQPVLLMGIVLILLSLTLWLLLLVLLLSVLLSILTIIPTSRTRLPARLLNWGLAVLLCVGCGASSVFMLALQATAGGMSFEVAGVTASVRLAGGFWTTVGGLVLALIRLFMSRVLAESLRGWTDTLGGLYAG